ncbi:MAG: Ig-like domain-containing protein [Candidatus Methylomirabilales bacterium]
MRSRCLWRRAADALFLSLCVLLASGDRAHARDPISLHDQLHQIVAQAKQGGTAAERTAAVRRLACTTEDVALWTVLEVSAHDPDDEVRRRAVESLTCGLFSRLYAARALGRALSREPSERVRRAIIETLGTIPHEASLETLRSAADGDPSPQLRALARRALGARAPQVPLEPTVPGITVPRGDGPEDGVALDEPILLTLDEPMNPLTLGPGSVRLYGPDGGRVSALVRVDRREGRWVRLRPPRALVANATYTVVVEPTVEDTYGHAIDVRLTVQVQTEGLSWLRVEMAHGGGWRLTPKGTLSLQFNHPLDLATVDAANVQVWVEGDGTPMPGRRWLSRDQRILFFKPATPFPVGRTVRLMVTTELRDTRGVPLELPFEGRWLCQADGTR